MKILVDWNRYYVTITRYSRNGSVSAHSETVKPSSFENLCKDILGVAQMGLARPHPPISGIAVSICDEYDYVKEEIAGPWRSFPDARPKQALAERFKCDNVHVVNVADADVLALKAFLTMRGKDFGGAACLSFGLAPSGYGVGLGLLDREGNLVHSWQGRSWKVGRWECQTQSGKRPLCCLAFSGCGGGFDLANDIRRFLACQFIPVFHPRTIGVSFGTLRDGIDDIFADLRPKPSKMRSFVRSVVDKCRTGLCRSDPTEYEMCRDLPSDLELVEIETAFWDDLATLCDGQEIEMLGHEMPRMGGLMSLL